MSRIGNAPITLPESVKLELSDKNLVTIKGPKGEMYQQLESGFKLVEKDNVLNLERPTEQKRHKALHGLYRSLINNMVIGVSEGFEIRMELVGIGYKVTNQGQILEISVGYSHDIMFRLPDEVKLTTETKKGSNPTIILQSFDKQLVGQVAAIIRKIRPPEPYKGKGIKFANEILRRKAGKTAAK